MQRRAERKWEAYLAGAAVGGGAAQQQQQPEEPQGGSPKRPLEEDAPLLTPGSPVAQQGAGKRQRGAGAGAAAGGHAPAAPALTGFVAGPPGSPFGARGRTPSIATQLTDVHLTQQAQQTGAQQPAGCGAPDAAAGAAAGGGPSEASLAACLQAALGRCVEAGLLPALAYPPVRVQRATARQQKVLPPGVAFTSPFPLAAAGAVNKAAQREGAAAGRSSSAGAGGGGTTSPDAVASSLLAHCTLPAGLTAAALRGHINISGAAGSSTMVAEPAAAEPAAEPASNGSPQAAPLPGLFRRRTSRGNYWRSREPHT